MSDIIETGKYAEMHICVNTGYWQVKNAKVPNRINYYVLRNIQNQKFYENNTVVSNSHCN